MIEDEITIDVGFSWVLHRASSRCEYEAPHHIDDCGEFDPPRPGHEPVTALPRRPLRYMFDWSYIFAELARGRSMFSLVEEYSHREIPT